MVSIFPAAPPGLYPTPADPLVSVDFNGWWTRSFRLLKVYWRHAALLQLVWVIPLIVGGAISATLLLGPFQDLIDTPQGAEPDWHPFVRMLYVVVPLGLVAAVLTLIVSLATYHLVVQAALAHPLSVGLALRTAARRAPAYVGWGLLGILTTLVGFVFCFLPGYYVAAVLTVLPVVVLLERDFAVRRCFRLFHARTGDSVARVATIIGLGIGIGILEQILFGLLGASLGIFGDGEPRPWVIVALSVLAAVFNGASQVALAPFRVTAYADMRARNEPFTTPR